MAQISRQQQLSEWEYFFKKYFDEKMSPIIDSSVNYIKEQQKKEAKEYYDSNKYRAQAFVNSSVSHFVTAYDISHSEWNSKNLDDIHSMMINKINSDQTLQHDLTEITISWRTLMLAEIGEEKYKQMSANLKSLLGDVSTGDMAADYVIQRMSELFVEKFAKESVPKNSISYILSSGLENSLVGLIAKSPFPEEGYYDSQAKTLAKKIYSANDAEKIGATCLSVAIDGIALGGPLMGPEAAATSAGFDLLATTIFSEEKYEAFSGILGKAVFNDENFFTNIQASAKSIKPQNSQIVSIMNESMSNKVNVPVYKPPRPTYNEQNQKEYSAALLSESKSSASAAVSLIEQSFSTHGLKYDASTEIPQWMLAKGELECLNLASNFFGIAIEMKDCKIETKKIGKGENGKMLTQSEVAQKAYMYAKAASVLESQRLQATANQSTQKNDVNTNTVVSSQEYPNQISMSNFGTAPQQNTNGNIKDGWNELIETLGLDGFGDIGRNFGYVLAMLPEAIIGMFTGKSNLKFKDNLFPIASIAVGMFVKNPLLKMLLVGLGGANLFNKLGHETLGDSSSTQNQARRYVRHSDELLDSRLKDVAMKGNTMLVTIDGTPHVVTLNETAVDAYYKDALPLNVLANSVLRHYDEQATNASYEYERTLSTSQKAENSIGIK